ncbi:MAG: hypothetical protein VYB80_05530 [Actinomycetota bacterium]|nr:hypothetical protein [Actinomycetota bacterium]
MESDGPYYEDMTPGMVFPSPPAVTIDNGIAAAYQSIAGEALPLVLDQQICKAVTGSTSRLVSPGLLLHLSIGASTVATKNVIANLFYRNVRILRQIFVGETIHTVTKVISMSDSAPREDREPRGKVLLNITTTADGEPVLDYQRCPLIRLRKNKLPGYNDDLGNNPLLELEPYNDPTLHKWDLSHLPESPEMETGVTVDDPLRDVVTQASSLVRLTHNVAAVHRDAEASPYPQRLVYGGHTVALAQASLSRMFPGVASIAGWHTCDHLGPVFEGDLLSFQHKPMQEISTGNGRLVAVQVKAIAHRNNAESTEVLDWVPIIFIR